MSVDLKKAYEDQGHWIGIADSFKDAGEITSFKPGFRKSTDQKQVETRYRVLQGPSDTTVIIDRDADHKIAGFWGLALVISRLRIRPQGLPNLLVLP